MPQIPSILPQTPNGPCPKTHFDIISAQCPKSPSFCPKPQMDHIPKSQTDIFEGKNPKSHRFHAKSPNPKPLSSHTTPPPSNPINISSPCPKSQTDVIKPNFRVPKQREFSRLAPNPNRPSLRKPFSLSASVSLVNEIHPSPPSPPRPLINYMTKGNINDFPSVNSRPSHSFNYPFSPLCPNKPHKSNPAPNSQPKHQETMAGRNRND